MDYSDFPQKNKKRQRRRKLKQRSLHAKALNEGRHGQFRHRVFDADRSITRVSSSLLIKEYLDDLNETQEDYKEKPEERQPISCEKDSSRVGDEDGRTAGQVVAPKGTEGSSE